MNFIYSAPTKVYFGNMNYDNLIGEIKKYGKKVLILTGGEGTQEIAEKLRTRLQQHFSIVLKSGVKSNPEIDFIESIAMEERRIDVILTVGGGSVHDSGKALAIAMTHDGKLQEYTTDGELSAQGIMECVIPVITIPTIFGTGAEVSPAALIKIENKKRVIFSTYLYPKATFIDSSFALSLSEEMCVNAALDALVQGIESLVSTKAQSFSKRFSYSAIERVMSGLLDLTSGNDKQGSMEELALASIEGLYAVGQSTVGAAHAISDPLSGRYNIHHGEAVGTLLPYVVEANYSFAEKEYDAVKVIFERKLNKTFDSLSEALNAFYDKIGFDIYGLRRKVEKKNLTADYKQIIMESYNGDLEGNPREMTDDVIEKILNKTFGVI